MSGIAPVLARFAVIIAGYACASLAASAALHLAWAGAVGIDHEQALWPVVASIVISIPFVALFVAYLAFLPAIAAIGIAELCGRRDWLTYAIAGGVIAAVVINTFWRSRPGEVGLHGPDMPPVGGTQVDHPQVLMAVLGAGIVGGIVYRLVAGRGAGAWRRAPPSPTPPSP